MHARRWREDWLNPERIERKEFSEGMAEKKYGNNETYELMRLFLDPGRVGYFPPFLAVSVASAGSSIVTCPRFNGLCKPGTKTKLGFRGVSGVGVRLYWGIGAGSNFFGFLISVIFPRRGLALVNVRLELEAVWLSGHLGALRCTYHD